MNNRKGFAGLETLLVLVFIAIIGFVGWFVINAKHETDKNLKTTGSSQAASGNTGGTDIQSLQSDVNSINSANNQTASDLNAASSGLNDNPTFTSLP